MKTLILLGTARKDNNSVHVFDALVKELSQKTEVIAVRPEEVLTTAATARVKDLEGDSSTLHTWRDQVLEADRVVMVVPEYNHSFPGEWKMLVDALAPADCAGKPVYLVTTSGGSFAGVRVADHIQPVLSTLGFVLQSAKLHVPAVGDTYPADGELDEAAAERLQSFVEAIIA